MFDSVYISVFKDSLYSGFIGTINAEFAYPALLLFGRHDNILGTAAALAGSTLGLVVSYFVFVLLAKLLKKQLYSNPGFPAAKHYVDKFSPLIGALAVLPEFTVIPTFFFGVTQLNFKKFLIIIVFYRVVYYTYMLNTTHVLFN